MSISLLLEMSLDASREANPDRTAVVSGDLRLTVRDGGRWTPPVRRPERGRGLLLLRSLMDTVDVSPSTQGTTVRMTRSLG